MSKKNEIVETERDKLVVLRNPAVLDVNFKAIVAKIDEKIAALDLDNIKATKDNLNTIRAYRKELNDDRKAYETSRKDLKNFILEPYEVFNKQYEIEVKSKIDNTLEILDNKIDKVLQERTDILIAYAKDYHKKKLKADPITVRDKYEDLGIHITSTTKEKQIRTYIDDHFEKIKTASLVISNHEHSARLQRIWETNGYDLGKALEILSTELMTEKRLEALRNAEPETVKEPVKIIRPTPEPVTRVVEPVKHEEVVEVFDYTFKIMLSDTDLALLVEFLDSRKIHYELVDDYE